MVQVKLWQLFYIIYLMRLDNNQLDTLTLTHTVWLRILSMNWSTISIRDIIKYNSSNSASKMNSTQMQLHGEITSRSFKAWFYIVLACAACSPCSNVHFFCVIVSIRLKLCCFFVIVRTSDEIKKWQKRPSFNAVKINFNAFLFRLMHTLMVKQVSMNIA